MPKYTLRYFNARGRAEVSRLIFAQAGVEFEDVRYSMEEWANVKNDKSVTPFGRIPVLEIDGKMLTESVAIAQYLSQEFGLLGKNAMELGRILEAFFIAQDIMEGMINIMFGKHDEETKAAKLKEYFIGDLVRLFGALESLLGSNNYFVGSGATLADLYVFIMVDGVNRIPGNPCEKFPKLKAHSERIAKLPKIAAYLEKRPETQF